MIETYYRILKHDPEGKLVKDSGLIPSHSYVIQFLELVEGFIRNVVKSATDVDGAESYIRYSSYLIPQIGRLDAAYGNVLHGLVVGTNDGASAEDNEDYNLDTKILHGAGGGQLLYQVVTLVAPRTVGPNIDLDISRTFGNVSGGTITVKEIGLICKNVTDAKYHLLLRDVVSDEDVLDDYTLTVVYTLRTTV